MHTTLFGNRVFADVQVKTRSLWQALIEQENLDTGMGRQEESPERLKAEVRAMFAQVKEHTDCQGPAKDEEEARTSSSLSAHGGNQLCQHPELGFLPLEPRMNPFLLSKTQISRSTLTFHLQARGCP